jgi:hypothetical protein
MTRLESVMAKGYIQERALLSRPKVAMASARATSTERRSAPAQMGILGG